MRKTHESAQSIDRLALWTLSLGIAAAVLAMIAYFSIGDKAAAALILVGAASFIARVLNADARGRL